MTRSLRFTSSFVKGGLGRIFGNFVCHFVLTLDFIEGSTEAIGNISTATARLTNCSSALKEIASKKGISRNDNSRPCHVGAETSLGHCSGQVRFPFVVVLWGTKVLCYIKKTSLPPRKISMSELENSPLAEGIVIFLSRSS